MRRIAQISDLHFGRTDPAVVEGLLAELASEKPDLIIASGDFTMAARRDEYEQAHAFLARLPKPWIAVPGNHDISPYHLLQRFVNPFGRYRRFIADATEPTFQDTEIGVVCLNTVRTWAPERDWSQGQITQRQIDEAVRRLRAMPTDLFKIVVAHHPFITPPWDDAARLVGRADLALEAFQACGVGLVLGGHLHRHYSRFVEVAPDRTQVDAGGMRGPAGRLMAAQAGSATSTRLRGDEPNAYNAIVIADGVATVTVRVWDGRGWRAVADGRWVMGDGAASKTGTMGPAPIIPHRHRRHCEGSEATQAPRDQSTCSGLLRLRLAMTPTGSAQDKDLAIAG